MISNLSSLSKRALAYLGDAAHRRAAATFLALVATHFLGKVVSANGIAEGLEFVIALGGAAWSSTTPPIEPDDADEAGA
jgi:hypothetical protein